MSRRPTGTVTREGERWRARVMLHGLRYSETHETETKAWEFLNALLAHSDYAPKKPPTTLLSVGRERLDEREKARATRHIDKERSVWVTHVESWDKSRRPIRELERVHIRDLLRQKHAGGLEPATVKKILDSIRGTLAYAHDAGIVAQNVADGLRGPKGSHNTDDDWDWLRADEITRVMDVTADDVELRAIYAVAIYTGLRKSELWHLQWAWVDLDGPRPQIRVKAPLKSKAALRSVPLLPPVLEALHAWHAQRPKPQASGKVTRIERLVFPGDSGMHHRTYSARWLDKTQAKGQPRTPGVRSRAAVLRRVRFHDLRHTTASHLVQGTWMPPMDLYQVMQWMGHSSINVTQRYAHLAPDGLHASVAHLRQPGEVAEDA